MRKVLLIFALLWAIDLATPDIEIIAYHAIAPAIIAAIIGAIGSMAAAEQSKQGALAQASAGASGQKPGIEMESTVKSALDKGTEGAVNEAAGGGVAFKTGAEQDPFAKQFLNILPQAATDNVNSKFNEAVAEADVEGAEPDAIMLPDMNMEEQDYTSGLDTTQIPNPADAGKVAEGIKGEGGGLFGDMSTTDKMAMAASIASLLRGPAPPPPPGRGGGQGINMQPVSLRSLYGRQ